MPGDLPGVDSNEDKEGLVCVCVCVWGGGDHHCCGSQGWLTLGSCQLSERRRRIKSSTQKSVCINNNHLLWPLVLHLQGVHCGFCVCMWRVYHNVYATPFIHPHPPTFLPDPPRGLAVPHGWQLACGRALWSGRDPGCWLSVPASPSWDFTHFTVSANGRDCEWKHLKQCLVLQRQISGLQQWLDAA